MPRLEHIDVEITRNCVLNCKHCSAADKREGEELSEAEIKNIISDSVQMGLQKVGFTGGEPFLEYEKLINLIAFSSELNMKDIHIHTNGTQIKSNQVCELEKYHPKISISFLGSNAETHDRFTGLPGSFNSTLDSFKMLSGTTLNPTAYFVPIKSNFMELNDLVKIILNSGGKKLRLLALSPTGRCRDNWKDLILNGQQREQVNEMINTILKQKSIQIDVGFCSSSIFPICTKLEGHGSCMGGRDRCHIDAYGNVFPCTAASGQENLIAGNLKNETIKQIWETSNILLKYRKAKPRNECQLCNVDWKCWGKCKVVASYLSGDLTSPQCYPQKT